MADVLQTHGDVGAVNALLASLDDDGALPAEKKPNGDGGKHAPSRKQGTEPPIDDDEVHLDADPELPDDDAAGDDPDPAKGKKTGDVEKVDYAMEIPLADGSTVTLGALKDAYQDTRDRELDLQERENKMIERAVEQDRVLKYFDQLPPQLRYRAAQDLDEHIRRESDGVLDLIPTWRHEDARTVDHGLILELAASYGMKAEVAAELKYPSDRRIVKMLRDFSRLKASVKQARLQAKQDPAPSSKIKPNRTDVTQGNAQALADKAKQSRSRADEIAAVGALLKGV